jgi:hypothetical protein
MSFGCEDLLKLVRDAFPIDREPPALSLEDFLEMQKQDEDDPPATLQNWAAMDLAIAHRAFVRASLGTEDWPEWEAHGLGLKSNHLYCMPAQARGVLYPVLLYALVRNLGGRSHSFMMDDTLFHQGLDMLREGRLTSEQQSALLAVWCFEWWRGQPAFSAAGKTWILSLEVARSLLWAFLIDEHAEVPYRINCCLEYGYHFAFVEDMNWPTLSGVSEMPRPVFLEWCEKMLACAGLFEDYRNVLAEIGGGIGPDRVMQRVRSLIEFRNKK